MASSSAVQTPRDATCDELANHRCVFIVALGRTGSSHLLNLLNAIDGYRISGETDNSWLYLGWFASAARGGGFNASDALACEMRRLMLAVHNPAPRARVFGFKEIYSPFVRRPSAAADVLTHGVGFVRDLFPRAKFIFHWRWNYTRIASSDFWSAERSANETSAHFAAVVRRYDSYVAAHPDHAFRTTLEGLTLRQNQTQVTRLFDFLGERLTPRLRKLARTRLVLRDWSEETHQRRIKRVADDGTVVVEKKGYAFSDDAKKLLKLKRAAKALGTTPEEAAAAPQVVPPSARQQHKASAARKRGLVSAAEAAVVDLPAIDRDNGMLWMGR